MMSHIQGRQIMAASDTQDNYSFQCTDEAVQLNSVA